MTPTQEQFSKAHEYAMSKLCTLIPQTVSRGGLTKWDDSIKKCKITEAGCNYKNPNNPISKRPSSDSKRYTYSTDDRVYGEFWKQRPPELLVWRNLRDGFKDKGKVCTRGNYMLYEWCETPPLRSNKPQPGITNSAPFEYGIQDGEETCYIPKSYCDERGISYDEKNRDCVVPRSQKMAEFFAYEYLVRRQRRDTSRKVKSCDKRLKKNIKPVGKGIYFYEWNEEANRLYNLHGFEFGLMSHEIDPKYVTKDSYGYDQVHYLEDRELKLKFKILDIFNSKLNIKA